MGLHFLLEELVQEWAWVVAGLGVLEDLTLLGPGQQALVVGLAVQEPSNAEVVARSPEEKGHGEDGHSEALREKVEHQAQVRKYGDDGDVTGILGLPRIQQL